MAAIEKWKKFTDHERYFWNTMTNFLFKYSSIYDFFQLGPQNPEVKKQKQQLDAMNNSIRTKYINLTDQCSALSNSYKQITANYKEVQHIVLEKELIQWKREQQLAGNGFNMNAGKHNQSLLQISPSLP